MAPLKVKDVKPACPRGLVPPSGGLVVILAGRIGVDGFLNDLR
mgnify:CR=1 FL=1